MNKLREYARETNKYELQDLMDSGYIVIYQDVNLYVIYEELLVLYGDNIDHRIENMFGYYGPFVLLHIDGVYYWIMQV